MVVKLILSLVVFLFSDLVFADYEIKDNRVYLEGKEIRNDLISEELSSSLTFTNNTFQVSNNYNASFNTKTEANYIFDKISGRLKDIYKINYSPEYDIYYGYNLSFKNGIRVEDINSNYVDDLDSKFGVVDYDFNKTNSSLKVKLVTPISKINFFTKKNNVVYLFKSNADGEEWADFGYYECNIYDFKVNNETCNKIGIVNNKSYLYKHFGSLSKIYLIKGDKVSILDEKIDEHGEKWYFINYKGKKEINMWIKADSVDLN
ncbi:hypothetical protein [Rodentibacter genomosp. 2]|uniref:hypothetical protein n=1 Tax=Rodentibacter genomosp. 2 TaxID=1908266 RepID=UPI00117B589B